jgi:hypothetical protein
VMGAIADIVIETYAMDCALARALKMVAAQGEAAARLPIAMTQVYVAKAMATIEAAAKRIIADVAEGDMLRTQMAILRRLTKSEPANVIGLQDAIAARTLEAGKYTLA